MVHFTLDYFRSAPASPTHGLQFHAPAPVSHMSHENSPTKTVTQAVEGVLSQAKPTPTSPPTIPPAGLPPPAPTIPQALFKSAIPFQSVAVSQMAGSPLAVSVIKSSLAVVKDNGGADVEKNGFSQSSGEESPVESLPQMESKIAVVNKPLVAQVMKHQVTSQLLAGAAAPSSGECGCDLPNPKHLIHVVC